jgi:glycosyltransferase involved in cell wall biosynthesis
LTPPTTIALREPGNAAATSAAIAQDDKPASGDVGPARPATPRLSCVVPCWNECESLPRLLPQLRSCLEALSPHWEIILVDDGSTDRTADLLVAWARQPGFRVRLLSRNFGKEAALTAGLQAARGDVVAMLDADGQHPPALLASMLAGWREGADVVYAVRSDRDDEGPVKRQGTRLFYALVNAAHRVKLPPDAGDFRLMDRAAVDALLALPERNRFMKGLYAWVGFKTLAVPYQPPPRTGGRSSFGMRRLVSLSLAGLTAFTTWPLRVVSVLGVLFALVGFLYGAYLVAEYALLGNNVSGWTTIVVSLMLFSGVQMISLGVIGEYLARVYEEVKGRPLFIVRRDLGQGLSEPTP